MTRFEAKNILHMLNENNIGGAIFYTDETQRVFMNGRWTIRHRCLVILENGREISTVLEGLKYAEAQKEKTASI